MKIPKASALYETWLGQQIPLIEEDLDEKHEKMGKTAFEFLRATYYRWAQEWPRLCPETVDAPAALAVGDLHVENFGTWRDAEGRLVWGINDFDEASELPYTSDLVRLAASARLAVAEGEAVEAILEGYQDGLGAGARPLVLAERNAAVRQMAAENPKDPEKFWKDLEKLKTVEKVPPDATAALAAMLPEEGLSYRVVHRSSGLGSLGRERYTAIAEWRGGRIAREAKALALPALYWATGQPGGEISYPKLLEQKSRCPDPFLRVIGRWIVRRLSPDCSRIELASLKEARDERRLLKAMGRETANVHLGSARAEALQADLHKRPEAWLRQAAKRMAESVTEDFEDWRQRV